MRKSISLLCIILSVGFLLLASSVAFANDNGPELYYPEDEWKTNNPNPNPQFGWEDLESADNYRLVIDDSSDFGDGENHYDTSNINENSHDLPSENSLSDGTWHWKVKGEYVDENGEWSESRQFTVDRTPPNQPSLNSPEDGKVLNTLPNLDWDSVEENATPVKYKCFIDNDPDFESVDNESGWITDTNYQVPDELESEKWYWRVRAKDSAGNVGDNSEKASFTLDTAMPENISPTDLETNENEITFEWDNQTKVDNFEIWIEGPDGIFKDNTNTNSYIKELPDGNYTWKVRSFNPDNSHFSGNGSIYIDTGEPLRPSFSNENGDTIGDTSITLTWEGVTDTWGRDNEGASGVVNYELQVSKDSNFGPDDDSYTALENNQYLDGLDEDKYYYRVRAQDGVGNKGKFSPVWNFQIDQTPPEINSRSVSVSGVTVEVQWETDEPSESEIKYGTGDTYDNSISDSSLKENHSFTIENLAENTEYNYKIISTDNTGNRNSISDTFTTGVLDIPVSSVDNLYSSRWYTEENIRITASAEDNRGFVENVELYYRYREKSNESWGSRSLFGRDENSPWEWDFDKPEGDGHYQLYTRATDNEGKTEEAPSDADVSLSFDGEPPNILSARINGENSVTTSTRVRVSIEAEDATSGVDNMRFKYKGKWSSWRDFDNEFNLKLSYPNGQKTVSIQVKDEASLVSTAETSILLENATFENEVGPLLKGENKVADFSKENMPVQSVVVVAGEDTEGITVSVRVQEKKPSEISKECPENARNYMEIKTNAGDGELSQGVINFKVEKSWLEKRDIEAKHVKLWKLDESWGKVSVSKIDENESHVFYSAEVSDFSWFAISGGRSGGILVQAIIVIVIVVVAVLLIYLYREGKLQEYLGKLKEYIPSLPSSGDGGLPSK